MQFVFDALAWSLAVPLATLARFDFHVGPANEAGMAWAIVLAIALQGVIGVLLGLYRRQYNYGSFEEVRALGLSVAGVSLVLLGVARAFGGSMVPRTAPMIAGFLALVIAFAVRSVARLLEEHSLRPAIERSEPVVVFGAGNAGRQIVRTMLRARDSRYRPVALLDDDPQKSRLRIEGVHVVGTRRDIVAVAQGMGQRRC